MQGVKFVVRWNDAEGNPKRKEYATEQEARKARKWLEENGAASVDIAIVFSGRETVIPEKTPPTEVPDYRQRLL